MKYSVILPVRNGWPYIKECVESVIAQTNPDFELVILDNNSSDDTLSWLRSLVDSRIRVETSSQSLSIAESWARIVHLKKNEFITLIGHDDKLDADFLHTIDKLIELYPDSALYQTGGRFINAAGQVIRRCKPVPIRESGADYLEARFSNNRDMFGTGYVMRSADYDRLGGIPPFERLLFADDALWLSLMGGSYKVNDPADHFSVRVHPNSESASVSALWPSFLIGIDQFSAFLKSYDIDAELRSRRIREKQDEFVLRYHQHILIFAIIEASEAKLRITRATSDRIEASLARTAPTMAGRLWSSAKVASIAALNATPLRVVLVPLWRAYWSMRLRS